MKLVLLHAFPLDETMWEPQRTALERFDVVAPNLYELPGNTIDGWAEALLDRIDGELVPIGASMGGYVALAMARRAPERLRALVLVGARSGADSPERRETRNEMIDLLRTGGVDAFAQVAPFPMPPGLAADGLIRALEALRDRRDASDVVASFPAPLLLVVGTNDELLSADEAREIASTALAGRLEVIGGAGHIASQDQPKRFNELLLSFLDALAPSRA